jgi:hypothetical protein
MMMSTTPPRTVHELLMVISKLNSRKAVFQMLIVHLRNNYRRTDSGQPEMRVTREDMAVVPESHIEDSIIEMETMIDVVNAELEELQNQPFGGGAPPVAEAVAAEAAQKPATERKSSGKTRTQGSGPS